MGWKLITKRKVEQDFGIKFDKSYDKVFRIFGKAFPGWISYNLMKKDLNFILEDDIIKLHQEGFLEMKSDNVLKEVSFEEFEPQFNEDRTPLKQNVFRLSGKGFEFLNNLETRETNKELFVLNNRLLILTVFLALIGIGQVVLMLLTDYESIIRNIYALFGH